MPFSRPSISTLVDRVRSDLQSRLPGDPFLKRSFEGVVARVLAGLSHGLHGHLDWLARQAVPTSDADDQTILRWANLFLDPPRKQPTKASGPGEFTGTPDTTMPKGTASMARAASADAEVTRCLRIKEASWMRGWPDDPPTLPAGLRAGGL